MGKHKVLLGYFEMVFDLLYLGVAAAIGIYLLIMMPAPVQKLAGAAALVLAAGDAFHLLPRIAVICTKDLERFRRVLGMGKLVTSLTMTAFYLLLWYVGLLLNTTHLFIGWTFIVWLLVAVRVVLCVLPQNRWAEGTPLSNWSVWRNLPFTLQGIMVMLLFVKVGETVVALQWMWLAIALSFLFYLPVVLWAEKHPKLGMFMLPKTCVYVWMLLMLMNI